MGIAVVLNTAAPLNDVSNDLAVKLVPMDFDFNAHHPSLRAVGLLTDSGCTYRAFGKPLTVMKILSRGPFFQITRSQ
jgi:hypothetical protein